MKWLRKYSTITQPFTESLPIAICGIYHADEIFLKCKGEQHYYWDLIDHTSRFLVATHYSTQRSVESAKSLFKKAKKRADEPAYVVTDGLPAYLNLLFLIIAR